MRNFLLYFAGFLVLLVIQEFVLGSVNLFSLLYLYSYVMIIIMLPLHTKTIPSLLWATLVGAVMDIFTGTSALITISIVFMAMFRRGVVKLTIPSDIVSAGGVPFSYKIGVGVFFRYVVTMCILFAIVYFSLEMMSLHNIEYTLLRIGVSSAATTLLIFILQLPLRERKDKSKLY